MHRVFVYGTLKQGHGNHRLLRRATFIGRTVLDLPFRFVDLGAFPGLVRTREETTRKVGGEIYEVDDDTLGALDMLEGHPQFYERFTVDVNGETVWTYTLPESRYGDCPDVESTFWRETEDERRYAT